MDPADASPLAPGDVVELTSGSRPMRVERVDRDGTVFCTYFDGKTPVIVKFARAMLMRSPPWRAPGPR
jgi:uncharacterized protein YodC (DUF2158 family)